MVKFSEHPQVRKYCMQIAQRAEDLRTDLNYLQVMMDVEACHCNGNPLDLYRLLKSDDFNFLHDVIGITQHLDRTTGKLKNHFSPRFCSKE